ncbi:hypothetical protein JB92DRAFT_2805187 [Gautieria morchelliformis]|nr:hypothetical protein JB92DRAFT_2805187 [Gautieria morchelliformis]
MFPTPTNPVRTRSKQMWMDDGNMVLAAKDVVFRVHRSQLARQSVVFTDMFVSSPRDAEWYDGVPVFRLEDSSEDVLQLLLALYDSPCYTSMDLTQLAIIFRMSTKYMVDSVRRAILEALLQRFPIKWVKMRKDPSISLSTRLNLIDMAYEANAQILLPALYFGLTSYSTSDILAALGDLPSCTLAHYFSGREAIASQLSGLLAELMATRLCCKSTTCVEAWRVIGSTRLINLVLSLVNGPICPVETLSAIEGSLLVSEACGPCQGHSRAAINVKARAIWNSLPKLFGWVSWDLLRRRAGTDPVLLGYLGDMY